MHVLPHALTASRGVAGLVVAWWLLSGWPFAAFWLFVAAAFTDLFDGWLARRWGADRAIGAWLDPLADKVLADAAWIALLLKGWAPAWLVAAFLLRDAIVVVWFLVGHRRGLRYTPNLFGQWMASFEGTSIGILLFHGPWLDTNWPAVGVVIGVVALLCAVAGAVTQGVDAARRMPSRPMPGKEA